MGITVRKRLRCGKINGGLGTLSDTSHLEREGIDILTAGYGDFCDLIRNISIAVRILGNGHNLHRILGKSNSIAIFDHRIDRAVAVRVYTADDTDIHLLSASLANRILGSREVDRLDVETCLLEGIVSRPFRHLGCSGCIGIEKLCFAIFECASVCGNDRIPGGGALSLVGHKTPRA